MEGIHLEYGAVENAEILLYPHPAKHVLFASILCVSLVSNIGQRNMMVCRRTIARTVGQVSVQLRAREARCLSGSRTSPERARGALIGAGGSVAGIQGTMRY